MRIFILLVSLHFSVFAILPHQKSLPIHLTESEKTIPLLHRSIRTDAPIAPIRAFGEWEDSEGVMILWTNEDFIGKVAEKSHAILLADDNDSIDWWKTFIDKHKLAEEKISFIEAKTDSIWIRDYGPWFILDGNNQVGLVDTIYNRPRDLDDIVPEALSKKWAIPNYKLNLAHTGGNYYADGFGRAFSSSLVYSENKDFSIEEVNLEMNKFLGITEYVTSPLAPGITIEHFDTFGKLVAPDTIVWGKFPLGSKYRADSENYLKKLRKLKTPYGTSYKILRMKMVKVKPSSSSSDFRAYVNSIIHNKFVFMPSYGDEFDKRAKRVYEKALPGYEVVLVDAKGTKWGDSIHCRSRNKHKTSSTFVFPHITYEDDKFDLHVDVIRTYKDKSTIQDAKVFWKFKNEKKFKSEKLSYLNGSFQWNTKIAKERKGDWLHFYVEVKDSKARVKTAPIAAPMQTIDVHLSKPTRNL